MLELKRLREARGLNMRETAKLLGIPYTTYVNYEKGLREPTSEMLIILADFFEVSIDFLLGRGCNRDSIQISINEADTNAETPGNLIRIAARDGSYQERRLSDQQLAALVAILDQMPDATEDL